MDFIERWFGVSPDGGDGTLEAFLIGAIAFAVCAVMFRRRISIWLAQRRLHRSARCRT